MSLGFIWNSLLVFFDNTLLYIHDIPLYIKIFLSICYILKDHSLYLYLLRWDDWMINILISAIEEFNYSFEHLLWIILDGHNEE